MRIGTNLSIGIKISIIDKAKNVDYNKTIER